MTRQAGEAEPREAAVRGHRAYRGPRRMEFDIIPVDLEHRAYRGPRCASTGVLLGTSNLLVVPVAAPLCAQRSPYGSSLAPAAHKLREAKIDPAASDYKPYLRHDQYFLDILADNTIVTAMAQLLDDGTCSRMGVAARQHVQRSFSRQVFGSKLDKYVRDVVGRRRRSRGRG